MPVVAECDDSDLNRPLPGPGRRGRRPRGASTRRGGRRRARSRLGRRRRRDGDARVRAQGRHRQRLARRPARSIAGRTTRSPTRRRSRSASWSWPTSGSSTRLDGRRRAGRRGRSRPKAGRVAGRGRPRRSSAPARAAASSIVATDAPLFALPLQRLARRAGLGLARTGSVGASRVGRDLPRVLDRDQDPARAERARPDDRRTSTTSTSTRSSRRSSRRPRRRRSTRWPTADTVTGRDGHVIPGLPIERTLELLRAAGPARGAGVSGDLGPVDRLIDRATTLAGAWEARARIATTLGQERALLRLFGVSGLDRAGRPLAGEVVDRYLAGGTRRLAGGVALPFAAALLEYELARPAAGAGGRGRDDRPRARGGGPARRRPSRRGRGRGRPARRARRCARIGANRIARQELLDVLGDAPRPWIGVPLGEADAMNARSVIGRLVRDGADLAVVAVPVGRELADRLHDAGVDVPGRRPYDLADGPDLGGPTTPSSRRRAASAAWRSFARRPTRRPPNAAATSAWPAPAPGLAAPEQAVVAAFERIDLVVADPVAEIVDGRIDPDRALADHSFAHRLHRRAGAQILVGPGPLVVAPDLARGQPSDPLTRAGRALALQALSVGACPSRRADRGPGDHRGVPGLAPRRARAHGAGDRPGRGPAGGLRGPSGRVQRAAA